MPNQAEHLARSFRFWARSCAEMGAPLYAHLFGHLALDIQADGAMGQLLRPFQDEPARKVLPLRLAAAVHRWVLLGELPQLSSHYPSVGGCLPPDGAWPKFCRACLERGRELQQLLDRPCQTNEVGRSAALLGGFLLVAEETGLPLRLLELGTSAGLLLRWDHYRDAAWMPGMFAVPPPLDGDVSVVERSGCDLEPIDPTISEGSLTLRSCVWPDHLQQLGMLEEAIEICRQVPAQVYRADGADWLPEQLSELPRGLATVVFHSVFAMYPAEASLVRMAEALEEAAARATREAPLAWLRFEPVPDWLEREAVPDLEVRLALWPGGVDRLLATADGYGRGVTWLA